MGDSKPIPLEHHLQLLETIEQNPQVTQANLADQLGVAVGTVNWYLKRLIRKGYIKVQRMQRKRLLYLITPRGIMEKSRLGVEYMQASLEVYRRTRGEARLYLEQARQAGYGQIFIDGEGDLADICRLTCLEEQMQVVRPAGQSSTPILRVDGARLILVLPKDEALYASAPKTV